VWTTAKQSAHLLDSSQKSLQVHARDCGRAEIVAGKIDCGREDRLWPGRSIMAGKIDCGQVDCGQELRREDAD
jgi:hypothetical protein